MFKFPKLFSSKKRESELLQKAIVEANLVEQNEQNSEDPLDELLLVNEGEVAIHFTGVSPADGALLVGFFVSNGLSQKVKFDTVPLVLMDSDKKVLARQSFDGKMFGEIISGSTKACVVRFLPNNVYSKEVPVECKVCFDLPAKRPERHVIQYQTLPEGTTESQQQELERILAELSPMKPGEVNFSPLHAQITTQSDLLATVIIRNSSDKIISLEQIPLVVFDSHKEELARGQFAIKGLTIQPFKAIVWTFTFGSVLQAEDIDLSSWHIDVVQ